MNKLDNILTEVRMLPPADRRALAIALLDEIDEAALMDEREMGERGLAAWTASAKGEDWSDVYPAEFQNGGNRKQ